MWSGGNTIVQPGKRSKYILWIRMDFPYRWTWIFWTPCANQCWNLTNWSQTASKIAVVSARHFSKKGMGMHESKVNTVQKVDGLRISSPSLHVETLPSVPNFLNWLNWTTVGRSPNNFKTSTTSRYTEDIWRSTFLTVTDSAWQQTDPPTTPKKWLSRFSVALRSSLPSMIPCGGLPNGSSSKWISTSFTLGKPSFSRTKSTQKLMEFTEDIDQNVLKKTRFLWCPLPTGWIEKSNNGDQTVGTNHANFLQGQNVTSCSQPCSHQSQQTTFEKSLSSHFFVWFLKEQVPPEICSNIHRTLGTSKCKVCPGIHSTAPWLRGAPPLETERSSSRGTVSKPTESITVTLKRSAKREEIRGFYGWK